MVALPPAPKVRVYSPPGAAMVTDAFRLPMLVAEKFIELLPLTGTWPNGIDAGLNTMWAPRGVTDTGIATGVADRLVVAVRVAVNAWAAVADAGTLAVTVNVVEVPPMMVPLVGVMLKIASD